MPQNLVDAGLQDPHALPSCPTDRSFGHLSLGLSAQLKRGLALFIDYETLFAKDEASEHRLNFGGQLQF